MAAERSTGQKRQKRVGAKKHRVFREIETKLTVQIHHRVGLAPFKVLISRILRPASGLSRRWVCKHITTLLSISLKYCKK